MDISKDVAEKILRARDAIVEGDYEEAYHCLYSIANLEFDSIDPWGELEEISGRRKRQEEK